MIGRAFRVVASVNTQIPDTVQNVLATLVGANSISRTENGFKIKATMHGQRATELNKLLFAALRNVDDGVGLEAEWTVDGVTQRFSNFVLREIEEGHIES